MRLHVLQHVPFETPAYVMDWAQQQGITVVTSHLYKQYSFPNQMDFDALVIMGGPMGVHDEGEFPWLNNEKRFIEKAIVSERINYESAYCVFRHQTLRSRFLHQSEFRLSIRD